MATHQEQIPLGKSVRYYMGMALLWIGILFVISAFITGATNFGSFEIYRGPSRSELFRVLGGLAIVVLGGALMKMSGR